MKRPRPRPHLHKIVQTEVFLNLRPHLTFVGRKKSQSSKDAPWLPNSSQNSAEPLGFCRRVLPNLLHSEKPAEEPSHRNPKVLQNFGSQAQLFRPCNFRERQKGKKGRTKSLRLHIFYVVMPKIEYPRMFVCNGQLHYKQTVGFPSVVP